MLREMASHEDGDAQKRDPHIDARILIDNLERLQAPCPYRPRDLVFPRKDGPWNMGVCIVASIVPEPSTHIDFKGGMYCHRVDMTVFCIQHDGVISEVAVHSSHFDPWNGEPL